MKGQTAHDSDERKGRNRDAPAHYDRHCYKDGPIRNGVIGQRAPSINPERMKDFGEEDYFNGGVKTWEMKIVSHGEELLRDAASRPDRISLSAYNKCIRFEDISAAAFKIQCGVQKTPCMVWSLFLQRLLRLLSQPGNHLLDIPLISGEYRLPV
ncbi:UNVERIFIED_CONTAM: hypothetical protein K2H54_007735 [Gekko kuhli]